MSLRNHIIRILLEQLQERYPISFDMDEFQSIRSFAERIRYCEARLERISQGTSRIVYRIDQQKALKLAKNTKGLAQNQAEVEQGKEDYYLSEQGITTQVFNHHPQFHWVEMELASKLTPSLFQQITGFTWKDFQKAVYDYGFQVNGRKGEYQPPSGIDPDIYEAMWEDEFVYSIFDYIGNYGVPTGDLQRISSWGVVDRPEGKEIVMTDFGLTHDVADAYYE